MFVLIETRTSEKRLPANSKPLGFNCVGAKCGKDYGSIQFLPKQETDTRKIKRKKKRLLGRPEPDKSQIPKRPELNPSADYSLRNAFTAILEEVLLEKTTKDLAELRRNDWKLLPFSEPLSDTDRAILETSITRLKSRVEARKLYEQETERKELSWNVTEKVGDLDPSIYKIMRILSKFVNTDLANNSNEKVIVEREREEEEEEDAVLNNTSNNNIIKWNPITMIRKYRRLGDPFRHIDFPMHFYAIVTAKYGCFPDKIFSKNGMESLEKGFNIINEYRRPFYDRNYRYTWFEWFWIVRYAQFFTPRKAAKMLLALDGYERGGNASAKARSPRDMGNTISHKHIKDKINPVIQFWQDYFCYTPYFFYYWTLMHHYINSDPDLKAAYNKMLEKGKKENDDIIDKMSQEHLNSLQHNLLEDTATTSNVNNKNDYYLGTNDDDFKAVNIRQERIRIYHSNKNYQKEMEEFKNGLRKKRPQKKTSCTFSPSELPMDVRIKLHKEGKVPMI